MSVCVCIDGDIWNEAKQGKINGGKCAKEQKKKKRKIEKIEEEKLNEMGREQL